MRPRCYFCQKYHNYSEPCSHSSHIKEPEMNLETKSCSHSWVSLFYRQSNGTLVTLSDKVICEQCQTLATKKEIKTYEYTVISK